MGLASALVDLRSTPRAVWRQYSGERRHHRGVYEGALGGPSRSDRRTPRPAHRTPRASHACRSLGRIRIAHSEPPRSAREARRVPLVDSHLMSIAARPARMRLRASAEICPQETAVLITVSHDSESPKLSLLGAYSPLNYLDIIVERCKITQTRPQKSNSDASAYSPSAAGPLGRSK